MTLISTVFVMHTTHGKADAGTDAGFELIVRGPGGYEARGNFEDLDWDERERGRADLYTFEFDEPFDWGPDWTVSIRMRTTTDGWLPNRMFIVGKVASGRASDWVLMGAHRYWTEWFDRKDPPTKDEHIVSGFTFTDL